MLLQVTVLTDMGRRCPTPADAPRYAPSDAHVTRSVNDELLSLEGTCQKEVALSDASVPRRLLAQVVPDELLDAYERLLERDGCPLDEADDFLGDSDVIRDLMQHGMAHPISRTVTAPPKLKPTRPDLALLGTLAFLENEADASVKALLAGLKCINQMPHIPPSTNGEAPQGGLAEVIVDHAQITDASYSMQNAVRQEFLQLENGKFESPPDEHLGVQPPPLTVPQRTIYAQVCAVDPILRQVMDETVRAGEQARILPNVPLKMKIADRAMAMVSLTDTGMTGALVTRSPVLIAALVDYFEMLWVRAQPPSIGISSAEAPSGPLTSAQLRVLKALAEGMQDSQAANRLGMSVTSVGRHVSEIKARLGVETRLAIGITAHRMGLIE